MATRKTLYVTNRDEWRDWLAKHGQSETEVWLIYYKKDSGRPRIPYDDAVEEALCFGWIDSIVKRMDDEKFAQKFTPRRDSSRWSALNTQRVRKLMREGRMTEAGLAKLDLAMLGHKGCGRRCSPSAGQTGAHGERDGLEEFPEPLTVPSQRLRPPDHGRKEGGNARPPCSRGDLAPRAEHWRSG